ncbi:MAG: hypothetical protein LDL33_01290, partial [Desulfomonile sp.]|nr:hypothetical protein [Desulfomonile sp.]
REPKRFKGNTRDALWPLTLRCCNAAKIFYYLLQIAHTITQLLYNGSLLGRAERKALGALKNLAYRLLEAWRKASLTKAALRQIMYARIQIRFCPDTS